MSDFDPIKALREEIAGLQDVRKAINTFVRAAEQEAGEAEAKLNAALTLQGFADAELMRKQQVLQQLVVERERAK